MEVVTQYQTTITCQSVIYWRLTIIRFKKVHYYGVINNTIAIPDSLFSLDNPYVFYNIQIKNLIIKLPIVTEHAIFG